MANRLEPINLMAFTGGLNLRRSQFELAEDESPDMLNVEVDPRGGFFTRKGWQRWNADDVVDVLTETWAPRNIWSHTLTNGTQYTYLTNEGKVYRSTASADFDPVAAITVAEAAPHLADFTAWGDLVFISAGKNASNYQVSAAGVVSVLNKNTWSEIDAPVLGAMPSSEFVTTHAGMVFVAVTQETDGVHWNRVRWSHPGEPTAWRADDFLDIEVGGGKITGIMAFTDHLLIFKSSTMWALYGSDLDSWQLVQVSTKIGSPTVTSITRSETTAFFYSASDQGGIYAYQGSAPVYLSEALQPAFEEIFQYDNVFVSWAARRLWVGVPWLKDAGSMMEPTTTFVFDPNVGKGAWTMFRSTLGSLGLVTDNSDITSKYPLALFWSDYTAAVVQLDYINDAYDVILDPVVLGTDASGVGVTFANPDAPYLVTGLDEEILVSGDAFIGNPFEAYYRTRWLHGGWPDRKKSWRRPTFVCRQVQRRTQLIVETYRDYNETSIHRSRTLTLNPTGSAYWSPDGADDTTVEGFDWTPGGEADPSGTGANWGPAEAGSRLIRAGSQGLARSVQMKVRASPDTLRNRWGVDGIVAKIVMRRFR